MSVQKKRKLSQAIELPRPYPVPTLISRIFDPSVVLSFLTFLGILKSDISHRGIVVFIFLLPIFVGIPLVYFLWLLRTHQIHNIDVTNRKERVKPLFGLLGFLLIDIVVISFFDNPFLLNMFLLYFLWTLGFLAITLYWKISGHSGIATLASLLLIRWYGIYMWPVFFIVLLVSWARIVRRDHTLTQVVAGIIYSLIILEIWKVLLPL